MVSKSGLRAAFAVLLILSVLPVGYGYVTAKSDTTFEQQLDADGVTTREPIVPPRDNITVVATDSNSWRGQQSEGPRARAELVAFNPDGSVLYYNDTHTRYWDVDPVPGTRATVEYSYADHLDPKECPETWNHSDYAVDNATWNEYLDVHGDIHACTRNGFERVNLTTGETTRVWSQRTPGKEASRYHDIDRINGTHIAVADIYLDRVFIANAKTDEIVWTWNASDAFSPSKTGGPYPKDWSHINDVEVLEDGRLMVSMRNHDRVVFLNRDGLVRNWTLGEEDNYSTLYEQHNPDFIPESNGDPAAIVADSENNRVVEYQREGGEWTRTWTWRDARMQWPRDADRLPNDHTLIADSNGNRVFEVNRQGDVVWRVNIAFPYEVERLGTGDESTGGESAQSAELATRTGTLSDRFWITVKSFIPGKYLNGLMYITPVWFGIQELLGLAVGLVVALVWGGAEVRWLVLRRLGSPTELLREKTSKED
jgi:hypothetical protein